MPPYLERTKEQKKESLYGYRKDRSPGARATKSGAPMVTSDPGVAQEVRFVPRVYTADYTPIMRMGQEAAKQEWGWDLGLTDFLDTIIYHFFLEHGIRLAGYIIEEPGSEEIEERMGHEELVAT